MVNARITEVSRALGDSRKKLAVAAGKIDRQIRTLRDYNVEIPPTPITLSKVAAVHSQLSQLRLTNPIF
jgi:predicted SpoU family rRNA methylase